MSCISLAGWLSGVFKAVKLLYSFSTSGPSSTLKPISEKIDDISSITWETGWILPWEKLLSGRVTSIFSFWSFKFISFISISLILFDITIWSSSLIEFKSDANFFLSSAATDPNFLNSFEIFPFFPNKSVLIWLTLLRSRSSLSLLKN